MSSSDFFQNSPLENLLSGIPLECQTVWTLIRPDKSSGLIWVQTVCQGYQQTTLVDWLILMMIFSHFSYRHFISRTTGETAYPRGEVPHTGGPLELPHRKTTRHEYLTQHAVSCNNVQNCNGELSIDFKNSTLKRVKTFRNLYKCDFNNRLELYSGPNKFALT